MSPAADSETQARPSDSTAAQIGDSHASSSTRFTPGELLAGRYRLIAPLGKGGMGEVYRADDIRLGQPVALKFLPAAFAADPTRLDRLVYEVRIGRQIAHPNVCRLYDIAEADGHHFMVMEYVDGEDLASLLRRIGRLPGDKALEIARGICAGLAAAHDKGIIHRDLKPANVMIDGRGHARIADFGLAALADGGAVADMSGTPHYMAPEQLTGGGASLRSDVFALGLVLHEMLTGKRVFEAKSLNELRAFHAESKPLNLSGSATDVDPGLERVVLRCLARDPQDRPASARVVLSSLPGGDPLEAALLAGETPSPEMVAAAATVGDLRPAAAWAGLLAGLIGLVMVVGLFARVSLYHAEPLAKPPEALRERAREVLSRLGYGGAPADHALGFEVDRDAIDYARRQDASTDWWQGLATLRPGPYRFYYRQSPSRLWSRSWILTPPWASPAELGRITRTDPPLTLPGMTEVVLDAQGRLVSFVAVPPSFEMALVASVEPDWTVALIEASLDPKTLRPAFPRLAAPVDSDRKAAWDGVDQAQGGFSFHVEAASYHGRIVFFQLQGPWAQAATGSAAPQPLLVARVALITFSISVCAGAAVLVRRNLRLGRGDRRGARRLALFGIICLALAQLFRADHTSDPRPEFHLLAQILSQSLLMGAEIWLAYMALEPAVRRRWPHTLISWSRMVAGRFTDPMVGRDALVGALAGTAVAFIPAAIVLAPLPFGRPPLSPLPVWTSLGTPWHTASSLFQSPVIALIQSLTTLFFLYLLHAALRRTWMARLLLLLAFFAVLAGGTVRQRDATMEPFIVGLGILLMLAIIVTVLVQVGLLASVVQLFTAYMLASRTPFTLDWSMWYAGRSFAVMALLAVLLVASSYTSLGGKPLFGRALLDD